MSSRIRNSLNAGVAVLIVGAAAITLAPIPAAAFSLGGFGHEGGFGGSHMGGQMGSHGLGSMGSHGNGHMDRSMHSTHTGKFPSEKTGKTESGKDKTSSRKVSSDRTSSDKKKFTSDNDKSKATSDNKTSSDKTADDRDDGFDRGSLHADISSIPPEILLWAVEPPPQSFDFRAMDVTIGRQYYGERGDMVIYFGPRDNLRSISGEGVPIFDWSNGEAPRQVVPSTFSEPILPQPDIGQAVFSHVIDNFNSTTTNDYLAEWAYSARTTSTGDPWPSAYTTELGDGVMPTISAEDLSPDILSIPIVPLTTDAAGVM